MSKKATKGQIGVTTENIFPVIKQFLYSDHEIFLREIVANAVDATEKLKALASSGEFKGDLGEPKVVVELDEKKKILKVSDSGRHNTAEAPAASTGLTEKESRRLGVGIENTRTRLKMQCNGSLDMKIDKKAGSTVTIRIPKDTNSPA